jgi:hypothetical protein
MTFAIKLAGIEGGRGAISVGMPKTRAGRRSLRLRGLSESSPFFSAFRRIREEDLVHLDLGGLLPLEWTSHRTLGERQRKLVTIYGTPIVQEVLQNGHSRRVLRRIGPPVLEGLSALFLLRSSPLVPGQRAEMRVLGGFNLYRVRLLVHGVDHILVRDRPRQTIRIVGEARQITDDGREVAGERPRKFSLWLGQDRARIPYRARGDTKLGPAEAELTSYHAPRARLRVQLHRNTAPR